MKIVVSDNYSSHCSFIRSVPLLIEQGMGEELYRGRNDVWRVKDKEHSFIVKRYKRAKAEEQIIYTYFRPTKAARAFRIAAEYRQRGVLTPHEIAYIEIKERGLFTIGFFISEEAPGRAVSLDLLKGGIINSPLVVALTKHIVYIHSRGILHGDLNLANILYEEQSDSSIVFNMLDVNGSHFTDGWPSDDQCLHDLVRMTHSLILYKQIVQFYAYLRGWDIKNTLKKALYILHCFKSRRLK